MKTIAYLLPLALLAPAAPSLLGADAPPAWATQCASCHGKDGGGHTKAGRLVGAKDLTDAAYQKTFTDDAAFGDVKNGLIKDGKTKMKPIGGKLSDDEIKGLIAYVRTLAH